MIGVEATWSHSRSPFLIAVSSWECTCIKMEAYWVGLQWIALMTVGYFWLWDWYWDWWLWHEEAHICSHVHNHGHILAEPGSEDSWTRRQMSGWDIFLRIWTIFYNIHCETIPAEGTDGKEVGKIYWFYLSFFYELWIHERDKEKWATDILILEESGCAYYFISMCGDFLDSVEWCTCYSIGDSRSLMQTADWSQCWS